MNINLIASWRTIFLVGSLCLTLIVAGNLGADENGSAESRQPNILFVMADDLADWAIGTYGQPNAHTPHIDRMAREGIVFENAYAVSVVCSPARAAMLSGRYPTETGVIDVLPESDDPGLKEGLPTWAELLQSAGYRTAFIGKWHMGRGRDIDMPTQRGFHEFSGFLQGGKFSREPVVEFLLPGQTRRADVKAVNYDDVPGEQYTDEILTDLTIDFIRRTAESGRPFCVSLNFWAPHANTRFPRGFRPPYDDRSWLPQREDDLAWWRGLADDQLILPDADFPNLDLRRLRRMLREYHASVHSLDRNMGRLFAFLQDPNGDGYSDDSIAGNTVVVLTSDHGYMMGHHGMWHKGNGRWLTLDRRDPREPKRYGDGENRVNLFEHSLKVPFIMRWPARISPGRREAGLITHLDWFPTVAAIGGASTENAHPVRGTAIAALTGTAPTGDDTMFAQYRRLRMVRSAGWKLVRHIGNPAGDELYNLKLDPQEKTNLLTGLSAADRPVLDMLDLKLRSFMETVADPEQSELP